MNKFKHMVYCFGLHRRYTSAKALYLYENRTRLAKAEVYTPNIGTHLYMLITFADVDVLKKYSEAQEQLIDFEITFMDRVFTNRFEEIDIKEVAETLELDSSANNQLVFKSKKPIGPTKNMP